MEPLVAGHAGCEEAHRELATAIEHETMRTEGKGEKVRSTSIYMLMGLASALNIPCAILNRPVLRPRALNIHQHRPRAILNGPGP